MVNTIFLSVVTWRIQKNDVYEYQGGEIMASSCVVPIVEIHDVRHHPNADKLDLADVLGYQVVTGRDKYRSGDKAIYFPADVLIPSCWAEAFNVKDFLHGKDKNRVGRIRLRGEPSFGLIAPIPEGKEHWDVGCNVAEYFGVEKYVPPIRPCNSNFAKYDSGIDPYFSKYTDIENLRIFTDLLTFNEEVVVSEKIHGRNVRCGIINDVEVAGSRTVRTVCPKTREEGARSNSWYPWNIPAVADLLRTEHIVLDTNIILYGELFGGSVQGLHYGIEKGCGFGFKAFDLNINGKYVDYDRFLTVCKRYGVNVVPELFRGGFDLDSVKAMADGKSVIVCADHIREGIVVKPVRERLHPKVGRLILKCVGTEYELGRKSDNTDI